MDELKACPFCGSDKLLISRDDLERPRWVRCEHCETGWMGWMWNRRPLEDALQARIATLETERRWIPVEERLPEQWQIVNVFPGTDFIDGENFVTSGILNQNNAWITFLGRGTLGDNTEIIDVTYWRPLPAAPEAE